MHFRAVTVVALLTAALLARSGSAQTSRLATSVDASDGTTAVAPAPRPETVEPILRPSGPAATTRSVGAGKASPIDFDSTRVAVSLGIVLALIFALRWLSKRVFGRTILGRSSRAVHVLSRNVISPKQQLLIVQVGRRLVVVGDSGQQMNPLCEITDPDEMAALLGQIQEEKGGPMSNGFGSLFGRAGSHFGKADEPPRSAGAADEDDSGDAPAGPSGVDGTHDELKGLMDKVRLMARQFRRT